MGGAIFGDEFVSADVAKECIMKDITHMVKQGRLNARTGKRIAPDLLFAISVINRTVPPYVLIGNRLRKFKQAMTILYDMQNELEDILDAYKNRTEDRAKVVEFVRKTVGPVRDSATGRKDKPALLVAISDIKSTLPMERLNSDKRTDFDRAIETLFNIRDVLSHVETVIGLFWRDEDSE
jgi:hypothetical protein